MRHYLCFSRAAVLILICFLNGCVTGGYQFLHYENMQPDVYRMDRMAFVQSSNMTVGDKACAVEIYSKFYDNNGKLSGCGFLINKCVGMSSYELIEKWFAYATLYLDGEEISSAGFFSQNRNGPGKGQATCMVTEKPWKAGYKNQQPQFKGRQVSTAW